MYSDVTMILFFFFDTAVVKYDPTNLGNRKAQIKRLKVTAAVKASALPLATKGLCFDQIPFLPTQTSSQHVMLKPFLFESISILLIDGCLSLNKTCQKICFLFQN